MTTGRNTYNIPKVYISNKEILEYLESIRHELTDAYHTSDSDSDAFYSVDTARDLVDELYDNLEGKFENGSEIIAADGLPLNYPYGDGEGRLKGNN